MAPTTLDELTPDPKNARKHTDRNVGTITSALQEVGPGRSIVIDERSVILAGNATVQAAKAAGLTKVRVVDIDADTLVAVRRTGLSAKQKARLALFDNRAAELAEWDTDVLAQLQAHGVGLDGLWSEEELAALLADSVERPVDGRTDPDDVPAMRTTSIVTGDVFQLGAHRLVCGDAMQADIVARVLEGDGIDLVVTSPPYNVGIKYRSHRDTAQRDEYLAFIRRVAEAFVQHMHRGRFVAWNIGVSPKTFPAHQVVTLEDVGLSFYRQIIWQKSGVAYPVFPSSLRTKRVRHYKPNYTHEVVQILERRDDGDVEAVACALCDGTGQMAAREIPSAEAHESVQLLVLEEEQHGAARMPDRKYQNDVWHIAQSQSTVGLRTLGMKSTTLKHGGKAAHAVKEHPAPYPVELPRAFMGYLTGPGEIVFDPFGGSGSTLIACEQLRRCARLVELDPVYCQIVIDRWEAFTGQKAAKVGKAAA